MSIDYLIGDATRPRGEGPKIIVHVCNDIGGWGRGFVVALSKRWPEPEERYRAWHRGEEKQPFALGEVQFVPVGDGLWVANLIGQQDLRNRGGFPRFATKRFARDCSVWRRRRNTLDIGPHAPHWLRPRWRQVGGSRNNRGRGTCE